MKKILSLIILIILICVGFIWFKNKEEELGIVIIENQKITLGNEETKYSIEGNYPLITAGIPKVAREQINLVLSDMVKKYTSETEKEFMGYQEELKNTASYASFTYVNEYTPEYNFAFSPYLNFVFETYSYSGGAHGGTKVKTFIFDARTGRQVALTDLFKENYLETISSLATKEIKKIDPELETYTFAEDGLKPEPNNFESFEIIPEGLKFIFGDYQIGPYSVGRPEIILIWDDMKEILKPEFIANLKFEAKTS